MNKLNWNIFSIVFLLLTVSCSSVKHHESFEPTKKAVDIKENTPIHRVWNRSTEAKSAGYLVKDAAYSQEDILAILDNDPNSEVTDKVKESKMYLRFAQAANLAFTWAFLDFLIAKTGEDEDTGKQRASDEVKSKSLQLSAATFGLFAYFLHKKNQAIDEGISIHNKRIGDKEILTTFNYSFKF